MQTVPWARKIKLSTKTQDCWILTLHWLFLQWGVETSVELHEIRESLTLAIRPDLSYKSKPPICSVSLGKSLILAECKSFSLCIIILSPQGILEGLSIERWEKVQRAFGRSCFVNTKLSSFYML